MDRADIILAARALEFSASCTSARGYRGSGYRLERSAWAREVGLDTNCSSVSESLRSIFRGDHCPSGSL